MTIDGDLFTADHIETEVCEIDGAGHDFRPHTRNETIGGLPGSRTYWRCVWCHGVTCGDYGEADPCWLIYHHRSFHRSRAGEVWELGGNRREETG